MGIVRGGRICTSVTWGVVNVDSDCVNTFKETDRNLLLQIGGTDWVRTSDLALMKPWNSSATTTAMAIIDEFVAYKKATKGLTPRGEEWLRDMTGKFVQRIDTNITDVAPQQIVAFLAPYSNLHPRNGHQSAGTCHIGLKAFSKRAINQAAGGLRLS